MKRHVSVELVVSDGCCFRKRARSGVCVCACVCMDVAETEKGIEKAWRMWCQMAVVSEVPL